MTGSNRSGSGMTASGTFRTWRYIRLESAFIGSNGAGKTTLLHTICGLRRPASGDITFRDANITGQPAYRGASLSQSNMAHGAVFMWGAFIGLCRPDQPL
jgi:ABC-type branched-subunit amino acid transport system ATPase component